MTNNYLTDNTTSNWNRIPNRWIQPLTGSSLASGYTARPLSSGISNGLTVYNYTLYEKEENQKAVEKHFNGFERAICEKARAGIWTDVQPNRAPRQNRYTSNELSTNLSIAFII